MFAALHVGSRKGRVEAESSPPTSQIICTTQKEGLSRVERLGCFTLLTTVLSFYKSEVTSSTTCHSNTKAQIIHHLIPGICGSESAG